MKRSPLKRRSVAMTQKMVVYNAKKDRFLREHPWCCACNLITRLLGLRNIIRKARDVHHTMGRGKFLLDESTWRQCCRRCHDYIEENKRWARLVGFIGYK